MRITAYSLVLLACCLFIGSPVFGQPLTEDYAASVNGELIPMNEFLKGSEMVKKQLQASGEISLEAAEGQEAFRLAMRSVLDQLIDGAIVRQMSAAGGVEVATSEIKAKIEAVKSGFPSSADFHRSLGEQGITVEELKKGIKQQILQEKLTKILTSQLKVSDDEAKIFYQRNLDFFVQPERIRLSQLFVATKEAAEEIQKKARAGDEIAMDDLGYIEKGQLRPDLEVIAFLLKPGKLSPTIETKEGFYVLRVEEKIPPKETKFDQVKESIEKFLLEEKGRTAFSDWLKDQRDKAKIELNESLKNVMLD